MIATASSMLPIGISLFNNQIAYYIQGKISSSDSLTGMIFMSDKALSFGTYSCFELPVFVAGVSGTFSFTASGTTTPTYTAANLVTGNLQPITYETGINGYYAPTVSRQEIEEVYGVIGRSYTWGSNA